MAEIFQQNGRSLFESEFITVSGVKVTPDLGYAKVYLSFFNAKDNRLLLELIQFHTPQLRKLLASRIRNQVKKIPELEFYIDDSLDKVWRMEKLLNNLNIPKDKPEDE